MRDCSCIFIGLLLGGGIVAAASAAGAAEGGTTERVSVGRGGVRGES